MNLTKPVLCTLLASLAVAPVAAETRLVVRKTDDALDWMDPGSGLRLAPGSALPVRLLVSRDGQSTFVAATMVDRVIQYGISTPAPLRVIEVDGEPDGLASTPVIPQSACHACEPSAPASR